MKVYKSQDIKSMNKIFRLNLINSITGIKPANLIGTKSKDNFENLAIFSSVVHLGSNPALLAMVSRPQHNGLKDTYANIKETGYYTINHVSSDFIEKAHYTSAKLEREISEFEIMNLDAEYSENFYAPFVLQSHLKIGMKYIEGIDLPNGCILIIGEVEMIQVPEKSINELGQINLENHEAVGISGLDTYYSLKKLKQFSYAHKNEIPDFKD